MAFQWPLIGPFSAIFLMRKAFHFAPWRALYVLDEEQKYNFWVSLTICLLYFLKVNHHFNFALGYPWKLQIEFFIIGSDNIFSFVFSHLQNTSAIINNTTSRQFGFKNSQKKFKNATKSLWPLKFFVWSGNFDVFCFQRE